MTGAVRLTKEHHEALLAAEKQFGVSVDAILGIVLAAARHSLQNGEAHPEAVAAAADMLGEMLNPASEGAVQ